MKRQFLFYLFFSCVVPLLSAQQQEKKSIRLLFLGDIMGHTPQIKAAYNKVTKEYNYDSNYQFIKGLLSKSDFTIGNLEVTLGTKPYSGYPQFSSPASLVTAIKNAGVDVLATANNHSCDRHKKGIQKTIDILDNHQMMHLGTYKSGRAKDSVKPLLLEKNNIRIALLNYTYGTNGIKVPKGNVVNLLDKEMIRQDIEAAKQLQPDQIIAFVHWGLQYKNLPSANQKEWFQYFKSLGVNIVIGSHPHVVQPMEWDKAQNTLVVYSLGNFISNQRTFPRDGGAVFELELTKRGEKTSISKAQYQLTWVYKKEAIFSKHRKQKEDYLVLPVDEFTYKSYFFTNTSDYKKMIRYSKHARLLLVKHNKNISENKPFTKGFIQLMRELY